MNDRDPGNRGAAEATTVHDSAVDLFQTAAMLLGQEQEAVSVVEEVVAGAEVDPCCEPDAAHRESRERVIAAALKRMGQYPAGGLDAELAAGGVSPGTCIESDDLSAAGFTAAQLEDLLEGSGRGRLREWLDRLPPALRAVFVLRALLGWGNEAAAEALRATGAAGVAGWQASGVSQVYRQALCSLATSMLHSSSAVSEHPPAKV